jgi:glycosyltransferase involved in cell wall biosynthesis
VGRAPDILVGAEMTKSTMKWSEVKARKMPPKVYFIAAVYNEEAEIEDLVQHVASIVNGYCIVDDESSDNTVEYLDLCWLHADKYDFQYKTISHTGLPETVKNEALQMVPDGAWVLMLDADERLTEETINGIREFFVEDYRNWDYVYFNQKEIIDGELVRGFQKSKLFRKEAIEFSTSDIHKDDKFVGRGTYKDNWIVLHRKSIAKQITREIEYLKTYKRLLDEAHIDEGRFEWLKSLHHFVRD